MRLARFTDKLHARGLKPWHWLGLLVLPIVLALGLIGVAHRSDPREVHAAVVNLDEMVTIDGQPVPLGRQLAAAMVAREGENISWTLADESSAYEGLRTGDYAAVVVIPRNFSAAATSFSANSADTARQATIEVLTSQNSAISDASLAQQIARIATDTINATLTENYLDNIYVGFNQFRDSMTTIASGAGQLHSGAEQLADGTSQAAQGANRLSAGIDQLASGGVKLSDGGDALVAGGRKLASGAGQYAAGVEQLSTGADQLADGIDQLSSQLPALTRGIGQLNDGAQRFADQLPAYTDGVGQLYDGFAQLAGMVEQLNQAFKLDQLTPEQIAQFKKQAAQAKAVLGDLAKGLGRARAELDKLITSPPGLPDAQAAEIAKIMVDCQALTDEQCAAARASYAQGVQEGFKRGVSQAASQAKELLVIVDPTTGLTVEQILARVGKQLDGILVQLDKLIAQVPNDLGAMIAQLRQAVTDARQLKDAGPQLNSGARQLADGVGQLNAKVGQFPAGVNQLSDGARKLATGTKRVAGGANDLSRGVSSYVDGVASYVDGVKAYADGVEQVAPGARQLADGLSELSTGSNRLAAGLGTFATELENGAKKVPSYDAGARQKLAQVVSRPIAGDDDLVNSPLLATTALLITTMMWLGALLAFTLLRPIVDRVLTSSRPGWQLAGQAILPAMVIAWVQAVVLGIGAGLVLAISPVRTLGLIVVLGLIGTMFVAVNHALAAWLKWVGRGVAIVMVLVTAMVGVSSALPGWFQTVAAFSPVTPALEAVRTVASGGDGLVGEVGVLLAWLALGLGFGFWAVVRRRQLNVAQFLRRTRLKAARVEAAAAG